MKMISIVLDFLDQSYGDEIDCKSFNNITHTNLELEREICYLGKHKYLYVKNRKFLYIEKGFIENLQNFFSLDEETLLQITKIWFMRKKNVDIDNILILL